MTTCVRLAEGEFTATQATPHLAQPGRTAQPVGERLLVRRISDVPCECAGNQLPPIHAAIFAHGRSFNAGGEPRKRARTTGVRSVACCADAGAWGPRPPE